MPKLLAPVMASGKVTPDLRRVATSDRTGETECKALPISLLTCGCGGLA